MKKILATSIAMLMFVATSAFADGLSSTATSAQAKPAASAVKVKKSSKRQQKSNVSLKKEAKEVKTGK